MSDAIKTRLGTVEYDRYPPQTARAESLSPVLLFVPGWCGAKEHWTAVCELLAKAGRECLALDFVRSSTVDIQISHLALGLCAAIDKLQAERRWKVGRGLYLVGHSMGARVIVESANELGARVRGVICVEGLWDISQDVGPEVVDETVRNFEADYNNSARSYVDAMFTDDTPDRVHRDVNRSVFNLSKQDQARAISLVRSMMTNNRRMSEILRKLPTPRLLLNSPAWRKTNWPIAHEHGFKKAEIANSGHYVMMERPYEVAEAIDGFVSATEAQSAAAA